MEWPFHPKYLGLGTAFVFFALSLWIVRYEISATPTEAAAWAALRTIFGFLGGACFTAWLTMSIFEYVGRRNQEREWKRSFSVDMVKEIYGPIYNELRSNLTRMESDFGTPDWSAGSFLALRYLALLAPETLIKKAAALGPLVREFPRSYDRLHGALQLRIENFANGYLTRAGQPEVRVRLTGGETRHLLGAKDPGLKEAYNRFLKDYEQTAKGRGLEVTIAELDKAVREDFESRPEAKELLAMFAKVTQQTENLLGEVVPLIKEPYARLGDKTGKKSGKGPGREGPA